MKNKINLLIVLCIFAVGVIAQVQFNPGWALDRVDARTGLDGMYHYQATGQGVRVYVVDSGIETTNLEFEGRAVSLGKNQSGCDGHGTGVAGVIASKTFGVAKQASLVSVQVRCTGFIDLTKLLKGLDSVYRDCQSFQRSGGRCVVNLSEGGTFYYPDFNAKVQKLIDLGAVVVASAGNDGQDACQFSPESVLDAIVVGGTRSDDSALSYSNYGPCVDLYAPGEGVATTWTGGINTYASGTSYSAPIVSGLVAIYLEQHPSASVQEVRDAIVLGATQDVIFGASPNLFVDTIF